MINCCYIILITEFKLSFCYVIISSRVKGKEKKKTVYMTKTKEYREKQTSKQANMFALVSSLRIPEPYLLLNNPDTFLLFGEGRLLINLPRNLLSIPKFSSVAQSCPPSCSPKNCGTPGSSVHHQLP